MIYLIQSAPVITAVVTYFQSLCFGVTPVPQRILLIFDPLRLICRDADIVECLILPLKPIDLLADKMRFKLRKKDGFDILVTHAPAYQLNDGDDIPHQGFQVFRDLMDCYKPLLFVHGHVHANYGGRYKRECKYNETRVVNAYERYYIDIDDDVIEENRKKRGPKTPLIGNLFPK